MEEMEEDELMEGVEELENVFDELMDFEEKGVVDIRNEMSKLLEETEMNYVRASISMESLLTDMDELRDRVRDLRRLLMKRREL